MDPKIKAKWLKALRSGKYRQGRKLLRERRTTGKDAYCCLGVLATVAKLGEWKTRGGSAYQLVCGPDGDFELLPTSAAETVGLTAAQQNTLAMFNDGGSLFRACDDRSYDLSRRWTFRRIANWIEANL